MTPKEILAAFQNEWSFEEISTSLFDLMQDGMIDVNHDKEFYVKEEE
jgi:hypothetical protein